MKYAMLMFMVISLSVSAASAETIPWPYVPNDQMRPIGNSYGEYQNYGGASYLHPGLDLLQPAGTAVYAVKSGYVKAVLTTAANLHWRVAIGDSAGNVECDGWLYAHLEQGTIPVTPGDFVMEGDYLGDLVFWPTSNFHHCHFVKIRQSGFPWTSDWDFVANPFDHLIGVVDTVAPFFGTVAGGAKFAFAPNQSHAYYANGATLTGAVDIIARIQDRVEHPTWQVTPDQVTYEIRNDTFSTGEIVSFAFTGQLFWEDNVNVIFQDDATYDTRGDYSARAFYFIMTNTDGDSVVESSDDAMAWNTDAFNNGPWWVKLRAYDHGGNVTADSMQVITHNTFVISGTVATCDDDPSGAGATIALPNVPGAPSTTTGALGEFNLDEALLGDNRVVVSREGYHKLDTIISATGGALSFELTANYLVGDVNADQSHTVLDVIELINVAFRGAAVSFTPYWSGDLDGNRQFDVIDVVEIIDIAFRNAVAPTPCSN